MIPTISKLRIVHFAKLHFNLHAYMYLEVLLKFLLRNENSVQNEKVGNTVRMGQNVTQICGLTHILKVVKFKSASKSFLGKLGKGFT